MSRYRRYVEGSGRRSSDERVAGHPRATPLERASHRLARWVVAAWWAPRLHRRTAPPSGNHTDRYPIDPEYVLRVVEPQP